MFAGGWQQHLLTFTSMLLLYQYVSDTHYIMRGYLCSQYLVRSRPGELKDANNKLTELVKAMHITEIDTS